MREGAKRRLAGAVVIVALAVIFVPMLFEEDSLAPLMDETSIPDEPNLDDRFGVAPPLPLAPDEEVVADGPPLDQEAAADAGQTDSEPAEVPSGEPGQLGQIVLPPAQPAPPSPPQAAESRTTQPRVAQPPPKPAAPVRATPPAPSPKPVRAEPKPVVPIAPPPRGPSDGMPSWVVQVSSLSSVEAAGGLATKLKKSGFSAFVEKAQVGGKTFYRVRVGPELDRANAERTAAMLRQKEKLDTLIQRYRSN